ncbi:MAG: LamG domain-containing protein, partial [Sphaerochaetaceae bacterium]|nr:LamG domain-containing protein [Sphaerochaetaceae bacterium]
IVNTNGLRHGEEINPEIEPSLANGLVGLWHLNEESGEIAFDSSGNGYDGTRSSESGASGITQTIDGDYTVVTFNSSGTFTIDDDITAEVLVVAGGGGGGRAGGGGAGGLIHETSYYILSGESYNVIVGAGGASFTNGENSVFDSLVAIGGGGGGKSGSENYGPSNGLSGGSGGGGGMNSYVGQTLYGGSRTLNQGNVGGNTPGDSCSPSGGGGGAGTSGSSPYDGGDGLEYSQFASVGGFPAGWFAGGGGGGSWCASYGAGGLGGGGTGNNVDAGTNGVAYTGGGGGGGKTAGSIGGSGIVIIKFLTSQGTATVSSGLSSSSGSSSGLWSTNGGSFNGSSDYISGSDSGFPSGASPRTVSFWAYPTLVNGTYHIAFFYGTYSSNAMTEIGIYADNRWYVSQHGAAIFGNLVAGNKWTFITAVYNGSNWYFYENGELVSSGAMTTNTTLNQFNIGAENGGSTLFEGKLEEIAVWNRAFSASEVSDLFNKGVARIGISTRACASEDCSTVWSSVQYGSSAYKYFSLPRSNYFQFKITSELIPFDAQRVIPESCISPNGANYYDYCGYYFGDYSSCSNNSSHNNSCYWYESAYCYPSIDCSSQGGDTCGNYGGCYWNSGYCVNNMECYYYYDSGSCESYPACDWYPYYYCEGSMWSYCHDNFLTEESCTASECYWGGDGCYNNTECYNISYENCINYGGYCYPYDYGSCSGDPYSYCTYNFYEEGPCSSQNGCSWSPSYCGGDQYGYCNYNFYDSSSCNSTSGCYWQIDYAYCEGYFTCENQLHEGSSSCTAFGSGCNYTAPSSTDYLSYFYNATPKLVDINILYYN